MSLGRRYRSRGHERRSGLSGRLSPTPGRVHWWLGVVCVLLWLGLWPALRSAEEYGSISGVIQREGHGVAAHRIMLIRRGPSKRYSGPLGRRMPKGDFALEISRQGKSIRILLVSGTKSNYLVVTLLSSS